MKYINLTRGKRAVLDDSDYAKYGNHSYYAVKGPNTYYAAFRGPRNEEGYRLTYYLHRMILGLPPYPVDSLKRETDHINRDGLDNRKSNLRVTDKSGNAKNRDNHKLDDISCGYCNKSFHPTKSTTKYCSRSCYGKSTDNVRTKRILLDIKCMFCHKVFRPHSRYTKYCSTSCRSKNRGTIISSRIAGLV